MRRAPLCTMRSFLSVVTTAMLLFLHRSNIIVVANNKDVNASFGGQKIKFDKFNWVAAIRRLGRKKDDFLCSGALIGSRYVITARNCVKEFQNKKVVVQVGYYCRKPSNCFRDSFFSGVRRRYYPKGGGDVALLQLEKSIPIQPAVPYLGPSKHPSQISLTRSTKKGRKLVTVGAGRAGDRDDVSFYVRKLPVGYLAPKLCRDQVPKPSLVADSVLCTVPITGNSCEADLGSALIVRGKRQFKGRDIIVAVHNFGPHKCREKAKKAMVNFRLEDAANLIEKVICEDGASPEADWCPLKVEVSLLRKVNTTRLVSELSVSFNSDGTRLITGHWRGKARIWDPTGGSDALAVFNNKDRESTMTSPRFHPLDDDVFAAGSSPDTSVKLWHTNTTNKPVQILRGHGRGVYSVAWNPSGTLLASASWDNTIKIWSFNGLTGTLVTTIRGHSDWVRSVSFNPDGTQLASAADDHTVKLWDATTASFTLLRTLKRHGDAALAASYSPDGQFLASASGDRTAIVWNVKTGKVVHHFREHSTAVHDVAWSPDGRLLATGSIRGTIRLWDARNGGRSLVSWRADGSGPGSVEALDWSPDGSLLASGLSRFDLSGAVVLHRIQWQRFDM